MKPTVSTWALVGIPLAVACLPLTGNDAEGDPAPSTPPASTASPDAGGSEGIPEIVASGDSAVVGPRGGRVLFPGEVHLVVPPGALEQDVTIRVHETETPPELSGPVVRPPSSSCGGEGEFDLEFSASGDSLRLFNAARASTWLEFTRQ